MGVLGLAWLIRLIATHLGSRQVGSPPSPSPSPQAAVPAAQLTPSPETAPPPRAPDPDGRRARSPRTGWLALALALALAWGSISAYNWLRNYHPPADLTASTTNLGTMQPLSLEAPDGGGDPTSWQVTASYVGRLVVSGPDTGTAEIIVPLPRSQCPKMAADLGGTCDPGGQVSVSSPVTFAWSNPQVIDTTNDRQVASTSIEIASSGAGPESLSVTVLAQTNARPSLCFSSPFQSEPVTLTVTGGLHPYSHSFAGFGTRGFTSISQCADGMPVLVGSAGSGLPPELDFQQIRSLTLRAWASTGKLQGFAGEIDLDPPGGATVLGSPTIVSLGARQAVPLDASLSISPGSRSLVVQSKAATSVITSSGQLVPSYWARNTDYLVPVLGGLVTVLFNLFGVSTQVLVDAVNRWRGPVRWRRDRRARKQAEKSQNKEVRHAT